MLLAAKLCGEHYASVLYLSPRYLRDFRDILSIQRLFLCKRNMIVRLSLLHRCMSLQYHRIKIVHWALYACMSILWSNGQIFGFLLTLGWYWKNISAHPIISDAGVLGLRKEDPTHGSDDSILLDLPEERSNFATSVFLINGDAEQEQCAGSSFLKSTLYRNDIYLFRRLWKQYSVVANDSDRVTKYSWKSWRVAY